MKNLLLFILLFPVTVFAQEVDLSLNGGICTHKISDDGFASYAPKVSLIGTFKASIIQRKTEAGVGIAVQNLSESVGQAHIQAAKPLINPYIFVNRMALMPNGYLYGGIMMGMAIANIGENRTVYDYYSNPTPTPANDKTTYQVTTGYTLGVQVGFVYNVTKHLGAGVEAAFRYIEVPNNYSLLSFPLTLGVRWRV